MRVSSSWLKEWLRRTILDDRQLAEALERAGMEVEQIIASTPIDPKVVVGQIKKIVQHPHADRLNIVQVTTGNAEFSIVCGAPNVHEGMKVALAQIGTVLPGGDKIQQVKLRGEASEGMLCSQLELGIGQDHSGILELPEDTKLGTPLSEVYPADSEIHMSTPANRIDVLSIIGLAREVAAMTDAQLVPLSLPAIKASNDYKMVTKDVEALRYMLSALSVDQSIAVNKDIISRLRIAGVRHVNPVVDVTNYVMLETGQPLHAFDADKVTLPITVRHAKPGEKITTLDSVERALSPADLVIADNSGPIALAGLMGGKNSEIDLNTKNILLESAVFNGVTVRKMAKRHGLRTEASARFERSLPVQLPPLGLARAIQILEASAGAKLVVTTDQLNVWPWVQRIGMRVPSISSLLGLKLTSRQAVESLAKLGIEARSYNIGDEARALVGKPYKLGATFQADGTEAFDCSYLVDYLYSLIGQKIGFTALAQFEIGRVVSEKDLVAGDALFLKGNGEAGVTDHYFTRADDRSLVRHSVKPAKRVSHVGIYVGDNKVVQASSSTGKVVEVPLKTFIGDSGYLGARRFVDNLDEFVSVPAVPWWRPDLKLPEDLAEEIVRVIGYDKVPPTIPSWRPKRLVFDRDRAKLRKTHDVMFGSGLFEVMTYSFVSEAQVLDLMQDTQQHLKIKNPLSSEQAYLRSSLLASHLTVLERNRTYAKIVGFYELSKVFVKQGKHDLPKEPMRLGVTIYRPAGALVYAKGILDALAWELNVPIGVEGNGDANFATGRSGVISIDDVVIGRLGQVQPNLVRSLKLDGEVAHFELDFGSLTDASLARQHSVLSRFPAITRDLAVAIPIEVSWRDVSQVLAQYPVEFVSDYYGQELPPGSKGMTLRITLSNPDRTPTEPEAADLETKVFSAIERKLGAKRR